MFKTTEIKVRLEKIQERLDRLEVKLSKLESRFDAHIGHSFTKIYNETSYNKEEDK